MDATHLYDVFAASVGGAILVISARQKRPLPMAASIILIASALVQV